MATAPDTLAPLRIALAALAHIKDRAQGVKIADAIEAAGIEISDDEGNYYDADSVIEALGEPDGLFGFAEGYQRAADDFWYGENGFNDEDERLDEDEYEGAQTYRDVYRGLEFALESAQWRDMPSVPADELAKRRAA